MKHVLATAIFLSFAGQALAQDFVHVGTNRFPALFCAVTPVSELRKMMCEDLSRYLSYNPNPLLVFKTSQTDDFLLLDEIVGAQHPAIVATNLLLSLSTNQVGIIIRQPLSEKYVELLSDNEQIQCLVTGAMEFVELFNSGMATNLPPGEQCRLFRTLDSASPPVETNQIVTGIKHYWTRQTFASPSLLNFSILPVWTNEAPIPTFSLKTRSAYEADWPETTEFHIGSISNVWFFLAY